MRIWLKLMVVGVVLALANDALALSQWSRKYKVDCTTCHSVFPRLNAYGDAFMQNGYQVPGSQDGDDDAKINVSDNLKLNSLPDIFGIRLSFTPFAYKSNARTEADGSKGDQFDVGKADWVQFFVGGSIAKNISTFIETEVTPSAVHINWFQLGFHNLLDLGSLANIRVGRLSAMNWHAMTGRLRAIPPVKNEIFTYKASGGSGSDSVDIASPYPAVEYYGYNEYILWAFGVQNGANATDPNDAKNYYATLKAWLAQSGDFDGSAISVAGLAGTDTKNLTATTNSAGTVSSAVEAENEFGRVGPALNIRFRDATDLQVAYFVGTDDNWTLARSGSETTVDFQGLSALLGQWLSKSKTWWGALQYDWIDSDTTEFEKATASLWFFPRQNMRIGVIGRADIDNTGEKEHEAFMNVRTMF
ncbi:MAG: hypothetical protein HY343_03490 [Lentisphaerae bacterium]|nr:hypothetical protein [Lentisphaerota bacterium]